MGSLVGLINVSAKFVASVKRRLSREKLVLLRIIAFKFLQAVPVILIISILAFLLLSLLPGDPAIIIAGEQASPEAVERVRQQLGLDRPFLQQLAIWLLNLAQGNFGSSLVLNQSVLSAVGERLPVTLSLTALSISVTIPIGVFLGSLAAYYQRSWIDAGVMTFALVGVSIPAFWIAILGIILFSVRLGWVPSSGFTPISQGFGAWFSSVILPALILSLFQIGFLARMTRSAMLDVLGQDFIRTARAKGLSEWRTVGKHALRNALILIITATGILVSTAIGGSVVIEQVFALPGIGRMVVQAILARDYPLVQGTMLVFGFTFVIVNLLVDVLYTLADPRVRHD
jgi:peptide/nickel transport system permease protein